MMHSTDYFDTLKLYQWNAPDPRPKVTTRGDYLRVFSRNLVGTWANDDSMMPSPMSQSVVFNQDGTGGIYGAFFTAFSGEFEWREKGEFVIEVRSPEESDNWFPIRWEFHGDPLFLELMLEDRRDQEEWEPLGSELIEELVSQPLRLSDERSWDDSPRIPPVPDGAEETSANGAAAWLSKGDSHWQLDQPPYVVSVTNTQEDGQDQHFFLVRFVAPKTGKRMSGVFANAPGHVDREAFLPVAERILWAVQKTYGFP